MATLQEDIAALDPEDNWIQGIYQLEMEDLVIGGPDGIDNLQAKQLLARTNKLKALLLALSSSLGDHEAAPDPHPQYLTEPEGNALIAAAVAALVDSSPAALDTLNELAAALGDDPNFATTITNLLAGKQPLDDELTAIAGLVSAANKLPYFTGAGAAALTDLTAFARTLLDDADAAAMRATLGAMAISDIRIRLSANLTVYVSTTGNDNNTGLSAGSPFLTLNKAYNFIRDNYDLNGYTATIQLADGTYTTGLNAQGSVVGRTQIGGGAAGTIILAGNAGTPTAVVIDVTGGPAISCSSSAAVTVQNMKLQGGYGIGVSTRGEVNIGSGITFGPCTAAHVFLSIGAPYLKVGANYTIAGAAPIHWWVAETGNIDCGGKTITLTGTPAFSNAFAIASGSGSQISCGGNTFSGSATGARYYANVNGAINTSGGGANYLPGSLAGSTATGGQYV